MNEYVASYLDIVRSLSKVIDLTHPFLTNHHERTSYIAGAIAKNAGYSVDQQHLLMIAGALHDIGVLFEEEFTELHQFPERQDVIHRHSIAGAELLSVFNKLWPISSIVRCHHVNWNYGRGMSFMGEAVPDSAHLLHLADRIDAMMDRTRNIHEIKIKVLRMVKSASGSVFKPEHVELFLKIAEKDYFWFDIMSLNRYDVFKENFSPNPILLKAGDFLELSKLISHIIDFRCKFTATHSASTAAVASYLAKKLGMSENECQCMEFAGYMHDVGKLSVPLDVVYKNGKLDESESVSMKEHVYHSFNIFNSLKAYQNAKDWAGLHHERLDGSGYPFGLTGKDIPLGARIMAIADVFSALLEDRPYRTRMEKEEALSTMQEMVNTNKLDENIFRVILEDYDGVINARTAGIKDTIKKYKAFEESIKLAVYLD